MQRKAAGGACPPPPAPPVPTDPKSDPKFTAVEQTITGTATDLKQHPTGEAEADKAQDAARPPADDVASQAKAGHINQMDAAKPKAFDKAAFIAALERAIDAAAPKDVEEAEAFASSGRADGVRGQVLSTVTQNQQNAGREVADKAKQPPDPSVAKVKPVVPLKDDPLAQPADPKGGQAMPAPAPPAEKDFSAGPCELEAQMTAAEITDEHLQKSNEPQLLQALNAKKDVVAHATQGPALLASKESAVLRAAEIGADGEARSSVTEMFDAKGEGFGQARDEKVEAKARDEAERARISGEINKIFDDTKRDVDRTLTLLGDRVLVAFDTGEADARQAFTSKHQADMQRWKDERYTWSIEGGLSLASDVIFGLPPEVEQIYKNAKAFYVSKMRKVISDVADVVGTELTKAKGRIADGRQQIKDYVARQPQELQEIAQEAAGEIDSRFDQLESDVDAKDESLISDLATKYVEAQKAVDAEILAEQEKNKGLVDTAKAFVTDAIDAINELKALFTGALSRAAAAFPAILLDPVTFINNFVGAVKQGFQGFSRNILEHLKKGLMSWLFGALSSAGIQVPETFDTKGILKVVLSTLGLTWDNLKARIAQKAPTLAGALEYLESKIDVFTILASQGIAGLTNLIAEKVGDLKEKVVGPLRQYVVERVVKAGISWIVGLLNPAGALIKIVQAIVSIVQWFRERASQLADLMNTVADAVLDISRGGGGGVPAKIESALAKAVPLVVSFLASLLGLGGISTKVRSTVESAQAPVNKAIDSVIEPAIKHGKKLIEEFKSFFRQGKEKVKDLLQPKTASFSMCGDGHELTLGSKDELTMASARKGPLEAKVQSRIAKLLKLPHDLETNDLPVSVKNEIDGLRGILMYCEQVKAIRGKFYADGDELGKRVAELAKGPPKGLTSTAGLTPQEAVAQEIKELQAMAEECGTKLKELSKAIEAWSKQFRADLQKDPSRCANLVEKKAMPEPGDECKKLLGKFGLTVEKAKSAQDVCRIHRVQILVRDANPLGPERAANPDKYLPKPEEVKSKTINERDVVLGQPMIRMKDRGVVGFFEPRMPKKKDRSEQSDSKTAAGYDPKSDKEGKERAALLERFGQRNDEWKFDKEKMDKLQKLKRIKIVNGKVGTYHGKLYAGDHDIFQILRHPDGRDYSELLVKESVLGSDSNAVQEVSTEKAEEAPGTMTVKEMAEKKKSVINSLRMTPFAAQHGALLDWEPKTLRELRIMTAITNNPGALLKITPDDISVA